MLREVIQHHAVRQPLALQWLVRQLESAFLIQCVGVVGVPIDPGAPKGDWPGAITWSNAVEWLLEG